MTSIIAHRGASRYAPENSFPAFKLAYEMKADGIETDVQLTKDNIPVLFHDESLKRIFGEKGWVNQYTLEQLKQLDMGKSFHPKFTGTRILSLEEFLAWIKNTPLMLHLELKNNKIEYKNLEEITYQLIEQYQMSDRTYFSTFSDASITRLANFKEISNIGWLTKRIRRDLLAYALSIGATAIHIKHTLMRQRLVNEALKSEIPVRVYTVNSSHLLNRCFAYKVDSVFTDVPDKAFAARKKLYRSFLI
ncbi:glycerophosphodiester phosphodiesterase [Oceanobacillus neutriphilus]|uniref:Glycerophosphoryl diester phosphodiesterase n=1 Tax=Oceanobacillus neutriphilus TaxID=531815 RepID=A0ABQ2NYL6_9BACI|nr:glycerophosphodiester phosphodiesterase family protein [Oceanobacillus neutriphilus]GGP13776.1 glycerophosphoryl diester phosphodiesterase [Oceanobacillus neutriphilus]